MSRITLAVAGVLAIVCAAPAFAEVVNLQPVTPIRRVEPVVLGYATEVGTHGPEFEPRVLHTRLIDWMGRDQGLVAARPELSSERDVRMEIAECPDGGEDDAEHGPRP